ncbi:TPA: hypothetical protein DDZ10_01750 [Candidatus Uhrbacteria bacterium]|nr:hypothetical protein [Candidatus Uhrbacteria bacterium]
MRETHRNLYTRELLPAEKKDKHLVQTFVAAAEEYLSLDTAPERKQEILENALKGADYFLLTGALHIGEHESSAAKQADLLTFLDDVRFEAHKRGRFISSDSWDAFLYQYANHPDSALLGYKALAMYGRATSPEVLRRVPIDHAKVFLLESARFVLEHPRAQYLDPPIQVSFEGQTHFSFSDLLEAAGEGRVWEAMSDDQIRTAWMDVTDENNSDLETREKLGHEDLRKRYPDLRGQLVQEVSKDEIVTALAPGAIGIFDAFGRLKSVSTDGGKTTHPLNEERLFFADANTPAAELERKTQAVRDVSSVMDLRVQELIEEHFGVVFSEMTLREQVWFASTLRELTPESQRRLEKFTKTYGVDGARSLLSAEFGDEFREQVLLIGERMDEKTARKIFRTFGEIAALAQTEAGALLQEFFINGKGQPVDAAKIEMELLTRAKRLIEDFARETLAAKAARKKPDSAALVKQLEQANADTALFTSIFKAAFKGRKGVEFEHLRGVEFGERLPSSFSNEEREEMLEVFDANWEDQDKLAAESFRGDLKRGFDPKNTGTHFYVTKKDGKMVGFIRFDQRDDLEPGAYYAGSLNIRPEYRGSAVGEAVLEKTLHHEAKEHVIYAHVVADAVVGTYYVENGLVVTGVKWIEKDGERVAELAIREDNAKNEAYRARKEGVTPEKLLMGVPGIEVKVFDYAKEKENFLKAIEEASRQGKVVTRYWTDAKNKNKRYIALESEVAFEEVREAA